jgi:hypothetical protein
VLEVEFLRSLVWIIFCHREQVPLPWHLHLEAIREAFLVDIQAGLMFLVVTLQICTT